VRLHPNAHQIIRLQHLNRLLFAQSHNASLYEASILAVLGALHVDRFER
jgi:hypothetical protein